MSSAALPASHLPNLLIRNRNFVLLWAAYGISAFGDHLSEMALFQRAGGFGRSDAVHVQALMTFCFFLPFAVLGPLAGWWADHFSRKATMIAADLIRAAIMLTIPLTVPLYLELGLGDFGITLPLLLAGIFAAFFSPSRHAMVPTLIRDDQLVRANAMISGLGTIGAILSAILGGWLVDLALAGRIGMDWNYRLDALTFLASAVLISGIALSRSRAVPHHLPAGVWTPLREGFRYVHTHRRVLQVILLYTTFWAASGVIISVVPALVRDVFQGTFQQAGLYRGLIAAGIAGGAVVLTILGRTVPLPLIVLVSVLGGAFYVALLDAVYVWKLGKFLSGLCLVMIGVHGAGILVSVTVVMQRFVPDARRGRVFGVADMSSMTALVLATGVLGLPHIPDLDRYIPWLLGAVALGLLVATVVAWREYRRGSPFSALVWLIWQVVRFVAAFWWRARRSGPCTVPRRGPVIVAANHTAGIDPLLILATCTYRLTSFVVAREYCRGPGGWFIRLGGCIPIDRNRSGKEALAAALDRLNGDACLGMFPQGRFEAPDQTVDARPGVGLLALRSGATVIPCHISGVRFTDSTFGSFLRRHAVRVRYGPPVNLADSCREPQERDAADAASRRIMNAIRDLAPEPQRAQASGSETVHAV